MQHPFYFNKLQIGYHVNGSKLVGTFLSDWIKSAFGAACKKLYSDDSDFVQFFFHQKYIDFTEHGGGYKDAPGCYMINLISHENKFAHGDKLFFYLTLFGKANNFLQEVLLVLRQMETTLADRSKCEFVLAEVSILTETKQRTLYKKLELTSDFKTVASCNGDHFEKYFGVSKGVIVDFISPTKIDMPSNEMYGFSFYNFIMSLAHRMNVLTCIYCLNRVISHGEFNKMTDTNNEWAADARKVLVRSIALDQISLNRKSGKPLGGFVGSIHYSGKIDAYTAFLNMATHLGIGKNTTLGMGCFKIRLL